MEKLTATKPLNDYLFYSIYQSRVLWKSILLQNLQVITCSTQYTTVPGAMKQRTATKPSSDYLFYSIYHSPGCYGTAYCNKTIERLPVPLNIPQSLVLRNSVLLQNHRVTTCSTQYTTVPGALEQRIATKPSSDYLFCSIYHSPRCYGKAYCYKTIERLPVLLNIPVTGAMEKHIATKPSSDYLFYSIYHSPRCYETAYCYKTIE